MATQRDVQLTIRARDEASKTVQDFSASLKALLDNSNAVAGGSATLQTQFEKQGKSILDLDKAVGSVSGKYQQISDTLDKQAASYTANAQRLVDLKAQLASAQTAAAGFREAIVEANVAMRDGFDTKGTGAADLVVQLSAAERAISQLPNEIARVEAAQTTLNAQYFQGAVALKEVGAQQEQLQSRLQIASDLAIGQVERQNAAYQAQQAELKRVADLHASINAATDHTTGSSAGDTKLAELLEREEKDSIAAAAAEAKRTEALRASAAQEAVNADAAERMARARASYNQNTASGASAPVTDGSAAPAAASTLLAEQLRDEAAEAKIAETALASLRDRADPLAAIIRNLAAETAQLNKWQSEGKITAEEQAAALKLLTADADLAAKKLGTTGLDSKGRPSLFGLTPNELTNFSYQINDVFTQLASGTSLMQTLAQQGGQIIQIFPKAGAAIVGALTSAPILATVAVVTALTFALKDAADQQQRLRDFQGLLSSMADGSSHTAAGLNAAAQALGQFGLSAKDAVAAVREFTQAGIDSSRLVEFGQAAESASEVLGSDLKDSLKQVTEAFTGGYDAIAKLDDATNFLTATQRAHILSLFEEGNAAGARSLALDIYTKKMDDAAAKQRGPWAQATRDLDGAWHSLQITIGDSESANQALSWLNGIALLVDGIANSIKDINAHPLNVAGSNGSGSILGDLAGTLKAAFPLLNLIPTLQAAPKAAAAAPAKSGPASADTLSTGANSAEAKRRADIEATLAVEEQLQALRDRGEKGLNASDSARREALAGEVAYNTEIKATGDAQLASSKQRLAVEHETAQVTKQNDQAAKTALAERSKAIADFEKSVVGAEGGTAKNPGSSAQGAGQFINSTWLEQVKQVLGDAGKQMSDAQLLGLRSNTEVAKGVIDHYAQENAKFLESFGAKVTAGNLYLAHFLGAAGAKSILTAKPDTPVDQLLSKQVLAGNKQYLYTNNGKGPARTAGGLQTFINGRIGDTGSAQSGAQVAVNAAIADGTKKQNEFNQSVDDANTARKAQVAALTTENALQGVALIAAQKAAAVDQAEADLRKRIADVNAQLPANDLRRITLTQQQVDATRSLTAAVFDLQHARDLAEAATTDATRKETNLTSERDALQQQADALRAVGDSAGADAIVKQVQGLNVQLGTAIDEAIAFYQAIDPATDPLHRTSAQIAGVIAQLRTAKTETTNWINLFGISGKQIADTFSNDAVNGLNVFIQELSQGKSAITSLWDGFRAFAADFLIEIAKMIEKQLIFNLVSGLLKSIGSSAGSSINGVTGAQFAANPTAGFLHSGGVVGASVLPSREVNPAWFSNAVRYHTGGIAGLAPDEQAAILRKGEEVLTADNPRHRNNAASAAPPPPVNVKIVNAIDAGDMVSKGLATPSGERAILNFIKNNPVAVGAAMGK